MVTISAYRIRQNNEGKQFIALVFQGDVEMIQSSETGRFYATAKKCMISSMFTEEGAKALLGKQILGRIERVQCEMYDYNVKETSEVINLAHTYVYYPEDINS